MVSYMQSGKRRQSAVLILHLCWTYAGPILLPTPVKRHHAREENKRHNIPETEGTEGARTNLYEFKTNSFERNKL